MGDFVGFPGEGASNNTGMLKSAIFSYISFEIFNIVIDKGKANIVIW